MLSLVFDIVTDVVSQAECPDSEFNFEFFLMKIKKGCGATQQLGPREISCSWPGLSQDPDQFPKWQVRKAHQPNEKIVCGDYHCRKHNYMQFFPLGNDLAITVTVGVAVRNEHPITVTAAVAAQKDSK